MSSKTTVHIINHTHWDREWFLSSIYTTHWIPTLIDKLLEISADNPDFRYLLDGQTLIIEDLLDAYPEYQPKVDKLIKNKNLTIGPYYCQPDWKLTCGESLIRNLMYGLKDAGQYGPTTTTGWMVDTFGHISQSPQIHKAMGIESVYVWRGMPILVPYFTWKGADGTELFGVDLFGGYRNLYGVTHAPDVAETRLRFEIEKLAPYYPTPDIPLFDGYDLEDNPEDSVTFLTAQVHEQGWELLEATPESFVDVVHPKLSDLPTVQGELNSGKLGAVFPGVYSTRTYTRVLSRDCAHLLYRWAEPMGVMAWLRGDEYDGTQYEKWSRMLLQNDVHDVTCGVSIDQVHEKAEDVYRRVFEGAGADLSRSLSVVLGNFAPGRYAISNNPIAATSYFIQEDQIYEIETDGIGIQPLGDGRKVAYPGEAVETFTWQNRHYGAVTIKRDGTLTLGSSQLGRLLVSLDQGDCYSDETKEVLGELQPTSPLVLQSSSDYHATLSLTSAFKSDTVEIEAKIWLTFDQSELLQWEIELDSSGVEFRVEMVFDTGLRGNVMAGMPFDVTPRPFADRDLYPRDVGATAKIFMGQRELNEVRSFPFHDFVAIDDETGSAVVFAKGINSYRAYEEGRLAITLRRSSEWVTRANLENRIGDAGPFFYVPDARCERQVKHHLAFALGDFLADSLRVQQLNAAFQNSPLIVDWAGEGSQTEWHLLRANLPLSSLQIVDGQPLARWYNPTQEIGTVGDVVVMPKKIEQLLLPAAKEDTQPPPADRPVPHLLNGPAPRVGKNRALPDEAIIAKLHALVAEKTALLEEAQARLAYATGNNIHLVQHEVYIHHREQLEYRLSARLNELKLSMNGEISEAYLYEPDNEVVEIGWKLNQLRIKRRIYDYVAAALT